MIAVDANGADAGPEVVARGAVESGERTLVFGPAGRLAGAIDIVDAPVVVPRDAEPVRAVRSNPEASIVLAAAAVAEGRAQALVSAGATGPTLAAATLALKRIRGVHRPALAALLPLPTGPALLLDAGASVEARPEHLVQFAHLGSVFMEVVHGIASPRVGLLSVGREAGKGTPVVLEARDRLTDGPLRFTGNIEGFDVPAGAVDVIVTDGFTGNVALKLLEGTSKTVSTAISDAVRSRPVSALGGLLIRGAVTGLRRRLDPELVGGAIMLGLRKPVVVAHGSFGSRGIANAVRMARRAVDEQMVERTADALAAAGVLRSAPAGSFADDAR